MSKIAEDRVERVAISVKVNIPQS